MGGMLLEHNRKIKENQLCVSVIEKQYFTVTLKLYWFLA